MRINRRSSARIAALGLAVLVPAALAAPARAGIDDAPSGLVDGAVLEAIDATKARTAAHPGVATPLIPILEGDAATEVLDPADIRDDGRIVVMVGAEDRDALADLLVGVGEIQRHHRGEFRVAVDPAALPALAASEVVDHLRLRDRLDAAGQVSSEGATKLGADETHETGATGAGVDVAVIDKGFEGWKQARDAGELGAEATKVDFCANSGFGNDPHGTAVAEIVADLAPEAHLHLICIEDTPDLHVASDYLRANDIPIANASIGTVMTGVGDGAEGPGSPFNTVEGDRAAGVLWVAAAGNEAGGHWASPFRDTDGNDLHEFGPDRTEITNRIIVPAGQGVIIQMRWDEFDDPQTDLNLYLFDEYANVVAASTTVQGPGVDQRPTEALFYQNPYNYLDEELSIVIERHAGTATPNIDLFLDGGFVGPEYATDLGTINDPASAPGAVAVGAVCVDGGGVRSYSSRGPTPLGVTKPDVVAFDSVSTSAYGDRTEGDCDSGFPGTSAATPHVAGAAALLVGERPDLGPGEIHRWINGHATDIGPTGPDHYSGAGKITIGAFDDIPERQLTATGNYVDQVYRDFLFRAPTKSELDHWTGRLDRGEMTRNDFTKQLAAADEWTRTVIDRMYQDTLGRPADDTGFAYWKGRYDDGMLLSEIAALIYSSDEYYANSGDTNPAYVDALFDAILGRPATDDDRAHWAGRLDAGEPRATVVSDLYRTGEARRYRVQDLYHVLLGRGPDQGGLYYWADRLLEVDAIELASVLASSDEYYTNAQAE